MTLKEAKNNAVHWKLLGELNKKPTRCQESQNKDQGIRGSNIFDMASGKKSLDLTDFIYALHEYGKKNIFLSKRRALKVDNIYDGRESSALPLHGNMP